jgi:hypothetical protein
MRTGEFNKWLKSLALDTINMPCCKNIEPMAQLYVTKGMIIGQKKSGLLSPSQTQYVDGMLRALEIIEIIEAAKLKNSIAKLDDY